MSNIFNELEEYHFERDDFRNTVEEVFNDLEDILSDRGYNFNTDDFLFLKKEDEYYLIHLPSGTMVNWYKHLGRTNTCNKNMTLKELKEFFTLFKEDLE